MARVRSINAVLTEYVEIDAQIKALEEAKKRVKEEAVALVAPGESHVLPNGFKVTLVVPTETSINEEAVLGKIRKNRSLFRNLTKVSIDRTKFLAVLKTGELARYDVAVDVTEHAGTPRFTVTAPRRVD
jgi:hypothetical protein